MEDALRLSANEVVPSSDAGAMRKQVRLFDFILDAVSALRSIDACFELLMQNATSVQVALGPAGQTVYDRSRQLPPLPKFNGDFACLLNQNVNYRIVIDMNSIF